MPTDPWYKAGLRFRCTQCGACCTGEPGYVWVSEPEIARLAAALRLDAAEFRRRYVRQVEDRQSLIELPGGDCIFFHRDSRSCQVYKERPRQCRTWPFWASNLSSSAAWEVMGERCPGANRGPLFGLEKIRARLDHDMD